jgi:hypothetical protein
MSFWKAGKERPSFLLSVHENTLSLLPCNCVISCKKGTCRDFDELRSGAHYLLPSTFSGFRRGVNEVFTLLKCYTA